ncbi:MAG: hypothetical protein AAGN46_15805 [Acidobacteriota bacterium]
MIERSGSAPAADPTTSYRRFAATALACVAGAALLGTLPTLRLAGEPGLIAMFAALAAGLLASVAGTVPIVLARHRSPLDAMPAQMGAMVVRLVAIAILGLSFGVGFGLPPAAFLLWLAIGHCVLLIPDTMFARSFVAAGASAPAQLVEERR